MSLCLLVGLAGALLAASATPALSGEDDKAVKRLIDLNKDALVAIDARKFEAARDSLFQAVALAKRTNLLKHKLLARTYVHLGAVYFLGFNDTKNAQRYFGLAKSIRADIKLTPSLASLTLSEIFDKAPVDNTEPEPPTATAVARAPSARVPSPVAHPVVPAPPATASTPAAPRAQEPVLPAALPSDLYCPTVEEGIEGHEIVLRCAVKPALKAERVLLYYRASGALSYAVAAMQSSSKGWLAASIPAEAVSGESMQYYCEARDSADNVVATNGQEDLPNPIILRPDTARSIGGPSTLAGNQDDGEDPLKRIRDERINAVAERALHRRRQGAFWIGAGAGTAYGYHLASRLEWRRDAPPVGKGMRFAGLITAYPEIGYLITDHIGVAVQGRIEYIPVSGSGDTTPGRPAGGAFAVLGRGLYYLDLGAGNAQIQFSADLGGGDGYRFAFPPTNADQKKFVSENGGPCVTGAKCVLAPTLLTDTIRSGPIVYGAGTGFIYHFTHNIAANIEVRLLAAGWHFGVVGEGYASLQFALGGAGPSGQEGDEPPRERLPEEDEEGE